MRQNDLAFEVRAYLKKHPCAAVVNLGCGLDNTGRACDNGRCKIYNLDFPDVIAVRQQLLPAGEREQNIPCDLKDPAWFDKIDASGGAVFFASGVFYYFLTEQVKALVQGMADVFPGGVLVFDAANRTAVKMIAKTWLRTAKIKGPLRKAPFQSGNRKRRADNGDYTVNPIEELELSDQLHDAVKYIHGTYQEEKMPDMTSGIL